jgi:mannose-6-phosphate isomerase
MNLRDSPMDPMPVYPLRFAPICQYRPWGGRRLADLLSTPLPGDDPIGEAWLLSDREDHASLVANGPLEGQTLRQLLKQWPGPMLGKQAGRFERFPLLLKFLDAQATLSVQVHPSDRQKAFLPPGESGKTEAWVVLEAGPERIVYAGLKPGTTSADLRQAITDRRVAEQLASFRPKVGDGIFIPAGTVHSLGDLVVFEVQENSDVTFRLDDWGRADPKTGQGRPLQVEQALACIDFEHGPAGPVVPVVETAQGELRERIFLCEHFGLWRIHGASPFQVGAAGTPRVLVCIAGDGRLEHDGVAYAIGRGDVLLLPAALGVCSCSSPGTITLLELSLPEGV